MPLLGSLIKKAYALKNKPVEKRRRTVAPETAQHKQLVRLLRKAQFTALGEHYKFSKILEASDIEQAFKNAVPIHDYKSMYKRWWYRSLNGETYVAWPGKVKYFALSSGTSEASSKYIPITGDMLRAIKRASFSQLSGTVNYDFSLDFYEKGILMIGGSTHLQYNGTYFEGDLSGITTGNIPFWFQHFYKPGRRISKAPDWSTKLDEMVRKAPDWDISIIVGVPAWVQILMERIISEHGVKTIHDIWPNLAVYVHSGVSFKPYLKSFEKLIARPLVYNESYLASEGYIAFQSNPNSQGMEMVLDNGLYFEFVPFNIQNFDEEGDIREDAEAVSIAEVEENTEYALLLSSNAGAWRYLIGDTIKFIDKSRSEILITGRTKHFISICGEHLSQENMNRAIELLQDEMNIEIKEFTVMGIRHENLFAHRWFIGTDDPLDAKTAANKIDAYLKNLNDDYRVERMEAIKDVKVRVLPTHIFYDYMKLKGKDGSANKFPRVLKNSRIDDWENYLGEIKQLVE
ncbi:MAG: GH3 auxin-responsive promoter family protein [Bacteroidales bacterium]|nr:GH3 auxin-responsive promoter family protein [Bacteroidales bacterium]